MIKLIHGECLEKMQEIQSGSVDMVLCDLPYGTTACKWDSVIPFAPLWAAYKRVCKPRAAIILTASQPFTAALVMSNANDFRYCWVWDKVTASGFAFCKKQPLRAYEDICVFCSQASIYNPQMIQRSAEEMKRLSKGSVAGKSPDHFPGMKTTAQCRDAMNKKHPSNVIRIKGLNNRNGEKCGHPTQKPVALMEYLIRTYTNEGETVLDNTMGSGTTGVACVKTGRNFIGIERDDAYFKTASARIDSAQNPTEESQLAFTLATHPATA